MVFYNVQPLLTSGSGKQQQALPLMQPSSRLSLRFLPGQTI